jgi:hypothetical protein
MAEIGKEKLEIFCQKTKYLPIPGSGRLIAVHILQRGEQMPRYYSYYSNRSRCMRKKAATDDQVPALVESAMSSRAFRKKGEKSR